MSYKPEKFIQEIYNLSSHSMTFLKQVREYCKNCADASQNASIVGYYLVMGDIVDNIITLRSMKTGESTE